jgi:diacylglycerol O-acyltransferase / wax synthase
MPAAHRLASADAAWLHMDRPTNLMVVNCVFWFEDPLPVEAITRAFTERLLPAFPHFAQRVVEPPMTVGVVAPRWVAVPDFRVEDHIHQAMLPAPGGDEQLHEYVSRQASVPLDPDRPLWHLHVLGGYRGGCALLLRTHHALADGTALVQALLTLVDTPEDADAPAGLREFTAGGGTSWLQSGSRHIAALLGAWGSALVRPDKTLVAARAWPATTAMLIRLGFAQPDEHTVLRAPLSGTKHLTWTTSRPLDAVRAAGKQAGATLNDIALTAIAGALRTYLHEHEQQVSRLTAVVPVNLRSVDEPFDPDRGNQFGLAFVRLPVGEPERPARLTAVCAAMNRVKRTDEATVVYGALAVMGQTPTQIEQSWLDLFTGRASAVITNIAGPTERVSLAGVPLAGFTAWVPSTGPIGVGLSVCSYAGELILGVAVDTALVPDSEHLLTLLNDEFDVVVAELSGSTTSGGTRGD